MTDTAINERQPRLDRLQLVGLLGLMLVGLAFVYSATMVSESARARPLLYQEYFRQLVFYGLGLGLAAVLCLVDYHTLARWSFVIYWAAIVSLVVVLIPHIGAMRYGARRWIDLGFFQFQPSEFAKLAFILAQAHFLSRPADELRQPILFWKALAMLGLPFVLIMKEPDLGSALVLIPTGLAMMFAAGIPRRYLTQLFSIVGIFGALFLVDVLFAPPGWQFKMEKYQRNRLLVYFGRDYTNDAPANATPAMLRRLKDQQNKDEYNVKQAQISVGSGGLAGKGWRKGTQNALGYLPRAVAHNDFIFSVIAEEKGFVGSVTVLTLYAVVLFTGLRIAGQARDRLGRLLAAGIVTILFSQIFINIGMNIRIMRVTGVPLPLLSYGRTSVICSVIALGLLQNVHIHRRGY